MSTKTWTTKADWDGGTYDKLYCPIALTQLELAYDELSGTATYVFDGGAAKRFRWQSFSHTKQNAVTIWRDDFRANSLSKYIWHNFPGWNDGAAVMPTYDGTNKRLVIDTGNDNGSTLEIPGLSVQNVKALIDVYITGQYPTNAAVFQWLRYIDSDNTYMMGHQAVDASVQSALAKWLLNVFSNLTVPSGYFAKNVHRWLKFEINSNSLKGYTDEYTHTTTDATFSAANKVLMGCWQAIGYIYYVLVEHYTLPSPANTTVSFKFWASNDGTNWTGYYTNIALVPKSRYIKIEVAMSRTNLLSAMPVLNDMTVGYELYIPQPIFI